MDFKTKPLADLPKPSHFGKAAKITEADCTAAMAELAAGRGISDGIAYTDKAKARNAAGLLRFHLRKRYPDTLTASVIETKNNKYTWWIIPKTDHAA